MIKFMVGAAMGAALVYAFLVYPAQSKKVVQSGIDTASTAIAQGATAAKTAADKSLTSNK